MYTRAKRIQRKRWRRTMRSRYSTKLHRFRQANGWMLYLQQKRAEAAMREDIQVQ